MLLAANGASFKLTLAHSAKLTLAASRLQTPHLSGSTEKTKVDQIADLLSNSALFALSPQYEHPLLLANVSQLFNHTLRVGLLTLASEIASEMNDLCFPFAPLWLSAPV